MQVEAYVRIARTIMDATKCSIEEASNNPAIPEEYRVQVRAVLEHERLIVVRDPSMVENRDRDHIKWLHNVDRNDWYYWPRLRSYLIDQKGWAIETVREIDKATDKILAAMENPLRPEFDTKALVVGYVQSGKTANYTSLISKAVDTGYRLIIVLTGMHNSLRYQTQVRLDRELVGILNNASVGVGRPLPEREWYTFTKADPKQGDFEPGNASATALITSNPVLIVTKKNGTVLRKLIGWLEQTQNQTRQNIPCLIIDDEADQASVNTGGNRPPIEADLDATELENQESPSTINGLIRQLLDLFTRKAYIAYTATPFANVLIDHEGIDIESGEDLYPKSFIIALKRPHGYYGAREIFGTADGEYLGMNVIRRVPNSDIPFLVPARRSEVEGFEPRLPESLKHAMKAFILSGAARIARGQGASPMAMLIHTSYRTSIQLKTARQVKLEFDLYRDEWRYLRHRLSEELQVLWETDFRPVIRAENIDLDMEFGEIQQHIGTFIEQVTFKELHGESEDEIDYEKDPEQKLIVIGGNRLSRGLTLEGLLVSYYVRPTPFYDTLMQMGRWFGYRNNYADLTRIYTTRSLEECFRDLATVEEELHGEIFRYEIERLTPLEMGVRIRQHSAMLVTSPLKMQKAQTINISLSDQTLQTITFPLNNVNWLRRNLEVTKGFLSSLGEVSKSKSMGDSRPMWSNVSSQVIIDFLSEYQTDPYATKVRAEQLSQYIRRQNYFNELTDWVVAVIGRSRYNERLGRLDLGILNHSDINLINRSKLVGTMSLKAITSAADQRIGLSAEQIEKAKELEKQQGMTSSQALRHVRSPKEGLLLLYPISKYSTVKVDDEVETNETRDREPLFSDPDSGEHIIGMTIVFPHSTNAATVEYLVGSLGALTND